MDFLLRRCKTAPYGESNQNAIFSLVGRFLHADAILEVDTSVKVF